VSVGSLITCDTCGEMHGVHEAHKCAELAELRGIVGTLAELSPFFDHNGCAYCGCEGDESEPHEDCIYARAKAWKARQG